MSRRGPGWGLAGGGTEFVLIMCVSGGGVAFKILRVRVCNGNDIIFKVNNARCCFYWPPAENKSMITSS